MEAQRHWQREVLPAPNGQDQAALTKELRRLIVIESGHRQGERLHRPKRDAAERNSDASRPAHRLHEPSGALSTRVEKRVQRPGLAGDLPLPVEIDREVLRY